MRAEDAWDVLGVEPTASAEEIRRAYLRAVKRCSPERDREGFQRVRRAFEVCRREAVWRDTAAKAGDSQVEAQAEEGEVVALAQRMEQIASALDAWRRGTLTESVRAELKERLGDRPFPVALAPLLVDDNPRAVVDAIDATISWVEAQPKPKPLGSSVLWTWLEPVLTTILMLVSAGETKLARECVDRLMEHQQRRPDLARRALGHHRWVLVRELVHLPASLPEGLARVLARELLIIERAATSGLSAKTRAYLAIHGHRMGFRARFLGAAPNLYAICYGRPRPVWQTWKPETRRGLTLIAAAMLLVLGQCGYRALRGGRPTVTAPPVRRLYSEAHTGRFDGPPSVGAQERARRREAALEALRRHCAGGDRRLCADLVRLMGAIDRGSCLDAQAALAGLDYPPGRMTIHLPREADRDAFAEVVAGVCPAEPRTAGGSGSDRMDAGAQPVGTPHGVESR